MFLTLVNVYTFCADQALISCYRAVLRRHLGEGDTQDKKEDFQFCFFLSYLGENYLGNQVEYSAQRRAKEYKTLKEEHCPTNSHPVTRRNLNQK